MSDYDKWVVNNLDNAIKKSGEVEGVFYRGVTADSVLDNLNPAEYNYWRIKLSNPSGYKMLPNDDWYETTKYTGIKTNVDKLENRLKGKTFTEKGFMSSSKNFETTGIFSRNDNKGVVLELHTKKRKAIDVSKVKGIGYQKAEKEYIFGRNTKYKIKGIKSKEGQIVLVAELI